MSEWLEDYEAIALICDARKVSGAVAVKLLVEACAEGLVRTWQRALGEARLLPLVVAPILAGEARASHPGLDGKQLAAALLVDGKQLAAVLRIKALWCLRCCALAVCGYGEGGREAAAMHAACASGVKIRVRLSRAYVSFHWLRTCGRMRLCHHSGAPTHWQK
jgi:hypothetical protein